MTATADHLPPLDIVEHDTTLVVRLAGRLDSTVCAELHQPLLDRITAAGKAVVLDMEDVAFVASAFLRLCILAAKTVGSGRIRMINVSPLLKKVFKIAGLDRQIAMTAGSFNPVQPTHEPVYPVSRDAKAGDPGVTVTPDGLYELTGQVFKSLSAAARQITGTQWNGPKFFGLRGGKGDAQ